MLESLQIFNKKHMNSKISEIEPGKYYSASQVVKKGWTMWNAVLSFTTFLNTDEGQRLYKPVMFTQGAVRRYKILGATVIEVLEKADRGELKINH